MSHRRARHLNPTKAGATVALDSRFISGTTDGSNVSLWARVGSATLTQSTSTSQPLYKTNIINGQSVVRFSNTTTTLLQNATAWSDNGKWTFIAMENHSGYGGSNFGRIIGINSAGVRNLYLDNNNSGGLGGYRFSWSSSTGSINTANGSASLNTWRIISTSYSGGLGPGLASFASAWVNGNISRNVALDSDGSTVAALISTQFYIGNRPTLDRNFTGDISVAIAIPDSINNSLRRKLEHSIAYSFKIQCS